MSKFTHVVFDLDGTLLNTLEDLADATNWVCALHGWPAHTLEEYRYFVGNGAAKLLERVAPGGVELTQALREQTLEEFTQRYNAHKSDKTTAYPGLPQLLSRLKAAGFHLGVLTNKPDGAAGPVVERYYPGVFDIVQGAAPGVPLKPAPDALFRLMGRLGGATRKNTLFVGDSNVDIQTAKNAGLPGCGVLWGFRTREELEREGADFLVENAGELEELLLGEASRKTRLLRADEIETASEILRSGGLVGIPTETVYGLGADGLNPQAVRAIFQAKGRPQDNPLILHVPDASWLERYCRDIPPSAWTLTEQFWPGPLTLVLRRREAVPDVVTAGLDTVGMRCPAHPVTREIIRRTGTPVAAPSGNTSGKPSPTTARHMLADMDGKIDAIVDGGACGVGVESTILDLTVSPPRLLRPGGVTLEQLQSVLGEVAVDDAVRRPMAEGEKPRAPGMKYRHYAPKAPVTVVKGDPERSAAYIRDRLAPARDGVICFSEYLSLFTADSAGRSVVSLGSKGDKSEQARRVFDALRAMDEVDVGHIWCQCPDEEGLGLAVTNRLNKAAGFHIIEV